jgi:hypothetical protein
LVDWAHQGVGRTPTSLPTNLPALASSSGALCRGLASESEKRATKLRELQQELVDLRREQAALPSQLPGDVRL